VKAKIPRISSPVRHLLAALAGNTSSPWYHWTKVRRGVRNHRPAWVYRDEGGKGAGWEVPDYDFHRALVLKVVEVVPTRDKGCFGIEPLDFGALPEGSRVRVRVTTLGRSAIVVHDNRDAMLREAKEEKRRANARRPLLMGTMTTLGKHVVSPPKVGP
jgi:hypothetical protein